MIAIPMVVVLGVTLVLGIVLLVDGANNLAHASDPDVEPDTGKQIALILLGVIVAALLFGSLGIGPMAGVMEVTP